MKRIKLLFLSFVFVGMANAANYFVDPAKADDSGNGTSWLTAKKTIAAAYTAAIAAGNWNNILVKGGIIDFTSTQTMGITANFYGSCVGNESSYTQRPLTDNDGNGIVESWEFQNPTTLRFTNVNSDALKLPSTSGIIFDGFTITHTGSSASGTFKTLTLQYATSQFRNNTIKNCDVTVKMTASTYGVLIKAMGYFTNNLIEKNKVTVNATADGTCAPTLEVAAGARVAQCLIRNNRVIMDYSTGATGNSNARGLIMLVTPSASAPYTSVNSCVIHNNEMAFSGNSSNMSMSNGTTVAMQSGTAASTIYRDSLINCTIAYNKGTTTSTAFGNAGVKIFYNGTGLTDGTAHYVLNNVCCNNYKADGAINNINTNGTIYNGSLANNYTNGTGLSITNSGVFSNNNNSIDAVSNLPNFISTPSTTGYLTDGTVETSNWRLGSGSYLIAKGVTTSTLKDKSGNSFAVTPSVGAYEDAKMSQSITFPVFATKTYGNADFIPGASSNTSSVVPITYTSSIGAVATIVAGQIHLTGAGQTTITASQASNTNYNAASNVQKVLTVSPATLTVSSAVAQNKVYDGTNAATLTGTLSGILNSDDVTLNGTGTFASVNVANGIEVTSTSTLGGAKTGSYTLTQPTGLTANIYPVTSTFSKSGTSNWSEASEWTYTPLPSTDLVVHSGELIIDQNVEVHSISVAPGAKVTLGNAKILTTNSLTINSDAGGTGTYVDKGTSNITNSTVNQWLTAGRNYFFSSPVTNATGNVILGVDGLSGNSLWQYNEENANWLDPTSSSTTFSVMKGFVAKKTGTDGIISFNGTLNSIGSLTPITIYRTDNSNASRGFNIVGNPFPCYVNWDLATTSNLETTIWYRTKTAPAPVTLATSYVFDTYNKTGGQHTSLGATTVSNLIPPMQSFWVRVSSIGSGTMTFDNINALVHGDVSTNSLKAPSTVKSTQKVLKLEVSNGVNRDEAIVYFDADASDSYDAYDSPKMTNSNAAIPEIYTTVGNEQLVINGLNSISANNELPLGFNTGASNIFSFRAKEMKNFDANTRVILKDNLLNSEWDMTDGSAYNFSSEVINTNNRFSIIFKSISVATLIENVNQDKQTCNIYKNANNQISITGNFSHTADVSVSNANGQKLLNAQVTENKLVIDKIFYPGIYLVTVKSNGYETTQKVIIN